MGKKRGRKSSYEVWAGHEVKDLIDGKEYGLKFDKTTKSFYAMLPSSESPTGTKRKWLGQDISNAVARFKAIVEALKGQEAKIDLSTEAVKRHVKKGKKVIVETDKGPIQGYELDKKYSVPETVFISWLKKELENPKILAQKTGIQEFMNFGKLLAQDTDIPLKDIIENYLNKHKAMSKKESYNSEKFFEEFKNVIDCKTVEQISLKDIHKYESYLHNKNSAPKYIKNKMNKISTIFKYNLGRYNSTALQQVYNWLRGLERPIDEKPFMPVLMSLDNFNALYDSVNDKWKLMLLLGLNSAMYPIDLARLKLENINLTDGTIAFRRGKTGKVLAVSTLWKRTKDLLQKYLKERKGKSEYIFLTQFGSPYTASGITNSFNESIRPKASIDNSVKFNHLRDTFSTLAQDKGYSIEQINLVMGHINKGMQDRYAVRQASNLTKKMCEAVEKEFFKK